MAEKFTAGTKKGFGSSFSTSSTPTPTASQKPRGAHNPPPAAIPPIYRPDSLRGSNDAVNFTHEQKSAVKTATEDFDIDFHPNILDNYDNYTYHFKLFITSLYDSTAGNVLNPESQTIITESGVTDITIDKVEIMSISVPSIEAGTGTSTTIKFEILEPGGAGLLDKMYYESLSLGVGNWLVMPTYLQLEFRSRDPETAEPVQNGASGDLGNRKWVWPIKLTDVKANVTGVGTRYDFSAIIYDELAQSNSYFAIQHNIVLPGLDNFGQAMAELEEKLNQDQYEKLIDNYSIADTYRIVVDPKLAEVLIALPDANKHTSRGSDFTDLNKKAASYNSGTGIDKIIDSLLGSSPTLQKELQSAATSTSEPYAANQASPMRKLWRIITETKPVAFDFLRQDNAVAITIYVVSYDLGLVETTAAQTGQTPDTLIAARRRLKTYLENQILRKKYNYIFTGLNDQIVSFDLNLNFAFAAVQSRFGGVFIDTASSDIGVSMQETVKNEQEAASKVRKTLRFINDPKNVELADAEIAGTISSIQAANIRPELKDRFALLLSKAKPADRNQYVKDVQDSSITNSDDRLSHNTKNAKSLSESSKSVRYFVSDVDISSESAQQAKKIAESSRRGKLRAVPFREAVQENNLAFGTDSSSDAGRARTASIFSTALYSTLDASLQQIKMVIKGDPYWLFPAFRADDSFLLPYKSTMSDGDAIEIIKTNHRKNPDSVNLFGTDNFIVIRFRTPRIYNDTTGINEPYSEIETFSGVYRVISVVSRFESGKFTQELTCQLDNLINLSDFPEFLRKLELSNRTPNVGKTVPPAIILPDTAIKTERILGNNNINGAEGTVRDANGVVIPRATPLIGSVANSSPSNIPSSQGLTAAEILARRDA